MTREESHSWEATISDHYPVFELTFVALLKNGASSKSETGIICVLDNFENGKWNGDRLGAEVKVDKDSLPDL